MAWGWILLAIVFALVSLFCFLYMCLRTYTFLKYGIRPIMKRTNFGIGGFFVFMIVFFGALVLSWIFASLA